MGLTRAKKIKIPVLIVHGDNDKTVSILQSQKLAFLLPNAKLVTVSGADHGYREVVHANQMQNAFYNFIVAKVR